MAKRPCAAAILIEPGEEFGLPAIEPESFEEIKQAIEARGPLSGIATLRFDLGGVYFADGTRWVGGVHYRPDYSGPGKYVIISQQEFDAYRAEASE